jgi:hypothetical protein
LENISIKISYPAFRLQKNSVKKNNIKFNYEREEMKRTSLKSTVILIATLVIPLLIVSPSISAPGNEQGSSNGQPFKTLQDQIDVVSGDLADAVAFLQQQINDLEVSQADQDTLIALLQSALNQLELRVLQNETDIAALEAWNLMQDQLIAALDSRLGDLEARVTANENDIAAIILADQAQQQLIQANIQQINLINQLIVLNAGDIDALELRAANLETDVANLQNDLNSKQDRVLGVCSAGSSIRQIFANGSVTCEFDNTSAGVGVLVATVRSSTISIPSSIVFVQSRSRTVTCPSTHKVSGGGHDITGGTLGVGNIDRSRPTGNSWVVTAVSNSVGGRTLRTYAQCLRVQ